MKILVTGVAGFIGYHLTKKLLRNSNNIVYGIDNLNNYYDKNLKINRLNNLLKKKNFKFYKININIKNKLEQNFKKNKYDVVVNLAAQAGVRYSIEKPEKYFDSNIRGFFNILENCKKFKVKHLLFASTSSVYGMNNKFPVNEKFSTDKPLSFYAATKKANEVMAHAYSNIYGLKCTALRFFTVFGPYGRPDMALFKFVEAILNNKKIDLYNHGNHERDFTYVDEVVYCISKLISSNKTKIYNVFNIGSNRPIKLKKFLSIISKQLNKSYKINLMPMQKGDVFKSHSDNAKIKKIIGDYKQTSIEIAIKKFIKWYIKYYKK